MRTITAGPGDPVTWGPYTGHPHDPRAPYPDPEEKVWNEDDVNDVLADFMRRLPDNFERLAAKCINASLRDHDSLKRQVNDALTRAFWEEVESREAEA